MIFTQAAIRINSREIVARFNCRLNVWFAQLRIAERLSNVNSFRGLNLNYRAKLVVTAIASLDNFPDNREERKLCKVIPAFERPRDLLKLNGYIFPLPSNFST